MCRFQWQQTANTYIPAAARMCVRVGVLGFRNHSTYNHFAFRSLQPVRPSLQNNLLFSAKNISRTKTRRQRVPELNLTLRQHDRLSHSAETANTLSKPAPLSRTQHTNDTEIGLKHKNSKKTTTLNIPEYKLYQNLLAWAQGGSVETSQTTIVQRKQHVGLSESTSQETKT